MTLAFDGGTSTPMLTALAEGVIGLLRPMVYDSGDEASDRGPYIRTLKRILWAPTDGELAEHGERVIGVMPSLLVQIGDSKVDTVQVDWLRWHTDVWVYLFCGHEAGTVAGRLETDSSSTRDERHDPGMDVLLQHAVEHLHGQSPSQHAGSLYAEAMLRVEDRAEWTAWALRFQVAVRQNICHERDAAALEYIEARTTDEATDVEVATNRKLLL